jgi:hypothetical protein
MTEEDYWASDPNFDEIIGMVAAQGEMLLRQSKRDRPTLSDYQIKPLYESSPWQPANTYYMVTLWDKSVGRLFDNYGAAFNWLRRQVEANNGDWEQG